MNFVGQIFKKDIYKFMNNLINLQINSELIYCCKFAKRIKQCQ